MSKAPAKWRPSLAMVTAAMIGVVLAMAGVGFVVVRFNVARPAIVELIIAVGIALGAAFVAGYVFVRAVSRPVRELAARAERITHGDEAAIGPLQRHGTRELATLSDAFMRMAASLSARSAYIRTFSRHVSHELKSPLTSIRGAAELLRDSETMSAAERARFLENIIADSERMSHLLDRLHQHARAETLTVTGSVTLDEIIKPLQSRFSMLVIAAEGELRTPLAMSAENALIVFDHLAANALAHGASTLTINAAVLDDNLRIEVSDDGGGIAPDRLERVFEPFFTTRREYGGTGMGLTITRAMLAAHGGSICAAPSDNGARFELSLPLHKKS